MPVARLTAEISIPAAQSIKDRRQVVRSMKDKLRHGFNVSVAEVDGHSHPSESIVAAAAIAEGRREAREPLERIIDALAVHPRVELLDHALIEV